MTEQDWWRSQLDPGKAERRRPKAVLRHLCATMVWAVMFHIGLVLFGVDFPALEWWRVLTGVAFVVVGESLYRAIMERHS